MNDEQKQLYFLALTDTGMSDAEARVEIYGNEWDTAEQRIRREAYLKSMLEETEE